MENYNIYNIIYKDIDYQKLILRKQQFMYKGDQSNLYTFSLN